MKTFNIKLLTSSLVTTLILAGCMPDSLTKFKKEPPKKVTPAEAVSGPVTDETGNVIDPSTLTDPTIFRIKVPDEITTVTTKTYEIGQTVNLEAQLDGSIGLEPYRDTLMVKCEIVSATALPPGISLRADECKISGKTIDVFSDTNPLNYGKPVPYTVRLHYISKTGIVKTMDTTISIGVYQRLGGIFYSQNDKLLMRLSPTGGAQISSITSNINADDPYERTGLLSTADGPVGVVKFVDVNTSRVGISRVIPIEVENITSLSYFDTTQTPPTEQYPSLTTARFISNNADTVGSNDAVGKVVKLYRPTSTSTRGIVYVEMISKDIYFQDGQYIDDAKTFVGNATRITTRDTTAGTLGIDTDFTMRRVGTTFVADNDYQFFDDKFSVSALVRIYEPGVSVANGIRLKPVTNAGLTAENNVSYSVSPALPSGLSLNPATGEITGAFTDTLDGATFNVTARNDINSVTAAVGLGAIYAPKDLSYTDRQLISVNSSTKFLEGEMLFQPITPPLETNIKARILRKIGAVGFEKLSIANMNGPFSAGAILDSGNAFYSEKTFISPLAVTPTSTTTAATPIVVHYNVVLSLASSTNFTIGGYVSNAAGALGRIVAIEGNDIFIQFLTPDPTSIATFTQGENVRNHEVYASGTTTTTISQVESNNLKIVLGATTLGGPTFNIGYDISTLPGAPAPVTGDLSAFIYDKSGSTLYVSDVTKQPSSTNYFRNSQYITDDEVADVGRYTQISTVSNLNHFFVENNVSVEIKANLSIGNNTVFTVTPALPLGLTLDARTGLISGKPTVRVPRKEYVISAVNLIGQTDFAFELEVRDYFRVTNTSTASSFIMHKFGDNQQYRDCKIPATNIIEAEGARDIRCLLEAEEKDLYNIKLQLQTAAGAGVCQFINVAPFSYYRYPPYQTDSTTTKYVVAGCAKQGDATGLGAPFMANIPASATTFTPTAEMCDGNYTSISTTTPGPNCDAGSFEVITFTGVDSDGNGVCDQYTQSTAATVNCGGRKQACLDGPVRDLLEETKVNEGYMSLDYETSNGATANVSFASPIEKGLRTNLRAANGTRNTACTSSKAHANEWMKLAKNFSATSHPFGDANPFYTFNCLDSAKDIKARIRVVVRDWNRAFKINSDIDLDPAYPAVTAPVSTMDASGLDPEFLEDYNNYKDWDDSYTEYGECDNPMFKTQSICVAKGGVWTSDTAAADYPACDGTALPAATDRHKYPGLKY